MDEIRIMQKKTLVKKVASPQELCSTKKEERMDREKPSHAKTQKRKKERKKERERERERERVSE